MTARRGTMTMEAVLVLPILIAMICGIFQLASLAMARVMLEYAAYAAARVLPVARAADRLDNMKQAAARVLAPVSGTTNSKSPLVKWAKNAISYPGWGNMPGTGWLARQVRVTVQEKDARKRRYDVPEKYQCVTVEFDFPLTVPVASAMFAAVLPNGQTLDGVKTVKLRTSACSVGWTDDIYPEIKR